MNQNDIIHKVEEYMGTMTELGKFTGSVLLAQDRQILYCAGYGFADLEHSVKNTPQTKFRIGSITKQFTAMAILILEDQGCLNVQNFIREHLPYSPDSWKEVKIQHLLNHTSGIPSLTEFTVQETTARLPLTLAEWIDTFKEKPLQFKPGSQHHYSNSGYLLLGDIIERVSGVTYEEFLKERIFDPLQMKDSGYDYHHKILPNRASGYRKEDGKLVRASYIDMGFPFAAGALYSTVEDLFRWDQALHDSRLISKEALARMNTITPLVAAYGYGTVIGRLHNRRTLGHAGGINGFRANLVRFVDEPACVIALSNSEASDFFGVTNTLSAILFGEDYQIPQKSLAIKIDNTTSIAYAGVYEIVPGIMLQVDYKNDALIVTTDDARRLFFPKSETDFFCEGSDDTITFQTMDDGKWKYLNLRQDGIEIQAQRQQKH